jgi:transposase
LGFPRLKPALEREVRDRRSLQTQADLAREAHHAANERAAKASASSFREELRREDVEAEKRRIVDEVSQPGVSLSQVARRYGIYRRLLFRWKEELRPTRPESDPAAAVFAPVQITDAVPSVEAPAVASAPGIEIELVGGRRVRFERDADPETVRRLVALLEGGGQ